jgi:hypothetical protein
MEERYPYIRFVIDAGQVIAAALAVIVLLGGTMNACSQGGFAGFLSFAITIVVACVAYVAVMVHIEVLRAFLDIESNTREVLAAPRHPGESPSASSVP